ILSKRSFPEIIRGCMESLAEQTGETVYLAAVDREAGTSTYVEGIDSPQPVSYWVPIGTSRPLYCSAAGLCLLARSEEHTSELQSLMRSSYAVFCLKQKK